VTGQWGLRLLLLTLAVRPAQRWLGWRWVMPLRRTFGLLAFTYAVLHFATWLVLDQTLNVDAILEDLSKRRYIAVGFAAFLCLVPLAVTSTRGWMKRLGRDWIRLHRLAYVAAGLAIVHWIWLAKADLLEPGVHAAILGVLLAARVTPRPGGSERPAHAARTPGRS
jgi:sulfoxide reductase heme-binding subunit YedZ